MEFEDVLRKRRMIRHFREEPLPDDVLVKLIEAGIRAPTGSNVPHRRLMLVKDPRLLRLAKAFSPGYMESRAQAIILIYTDLEIARAAGDDMACIDARIDAGAAAENIHLAAVDMGIGSSFFTSMSREGLSELFQLPRHCRLEIVIRLGYPLPKLPRPKKTLREAKTVYLDKYGTIWDAYERNGAQ